MSLGLLPALSDAMVIDLAHAYAVGMPQSPNHPPFRMVIERRHGDVVREDGGSASNELIIMGGHVGTHVDALAHVSQDGYLYDGVKAECVQSNAGFSSHDIGSLAPIVCRGVLLDVAAARGVDVLEPGHAITVDDLELARDRAGVELHPGDAMLIGSGWTQHWNDRATFQGENGGVPGPNEAAGRWLAEKRPRVVGGETIAFEHIAAGKGHATLPVHRVMLVESGINIIETMNLAELRASGAVEFGFVLNPLRLAGATGGPVRPLALIPGTTE